MKTKLITAVTLTTLMAGPAFAGPNVLYDYATVIDAEPIVKTIRVSTPREECWEEEVVYRDSYRDDGVGTVVGGVLGGAIGNAVGHKKTNKQVGTVVGAVLGATLGSAMSRDARGPDRYGTEEVCRVYHDYTEEDRIVGYRVRYRYNNQTFTTRTSTDPGDTIKIRLAVSPVI